MPGQLFTNYFLEEGIYRTKDMVLAYYNALNAGDTHTDVAV